MRRASRVSLRLEPGVSVRRACRVTALFVLTAIVSAHIGSPAVFFRGPAGPYDVRVTIRPPEVVPGVARVTVRAPADVQRVLIRPVYWRAGSKGAPSADETKRLEGEGGGVGGGGGGGTFEGSLWLMARGAYTVDVIVEGARGNANVLVPIASVATGRLDMSPMLAMVLAALGVLLIAGLVTIIYKGAGEALLPNGKEFDATRRRRAQRVAAMSVPVLLLAVVGGARWWDAVDGDYARTIYQPSPLIVQQHRDRVRLQARDTTWLPGGRVARLIPDHGKLMHLFLVRAGDSRGFAHLHPIAIDTTANPTFETRLPPLPVGSYHMFGDVVHETGFERTLVGSIQVRDSVATTAVDPDDAWFGGDVTAARTTILADGSTMLLDVAPSGPFVAGSERTFRITVRDAKGNPVSLQPYLGMSAHAVVARDDGSVYVHLHPMGTVTKAAQEAFLARDRGDTTASGRLRFDTAHAAHPSVGTDPAPVVTEFPYAFPKGGTYRLFVQVKRNGRVLTGAFAMQVAESTQTSR